MKHSIRFSTQKGMVLIAVLAAGAVMAIVGMTAMYMLKQNLRKAGENRQDFQTIHASEAGIRCFQNRLNNQTFCHPWFTYQDSLNLISRLGDTTITLPSAYGATRGVRIRSAQIVPNVQPIRVKFVTVGGKILSNGSLDTTG